MEGSERSWFGPLRGRLGVVGAWCGAESLRREVEAVRSELSSTRREAGKWKSRAKTAEDRLEG